MNFAFLYEFARIGSDECLMLIRTGAIKKCASFYMFNRRPDVLRGKNAAAAQRNGKKLTPKNANLRNNKASSLKKKASFSTIVQT